ncbi:RimK family alpha-L-glutamate ligase [Actimicrobium sp. CCC2.4]|uniref:ATP-grasp domain-containing protein n=1 Tax=Actimicrobium sp. CCC2.4 TaxID=3048606 RepID=UPI002AC9A28A|nr:RimK family alpha-L-glutamate ligase [Actimicrobium sp. CCC2.4]MEB0137158.1 RimK family alpha-L-glutamate ligase [Actimicrobium sp. CCC2.4]WPX30909.1 RimK family alpha-L-glutamate ligase [Actimicrobium sp. CCC2.4]
MPTSAPGLPPLIGVAPLMRRAFAGDSLAQEGQDLLLRAQQNPADAHAYLDFSTVLQLTGNRADALAVQGEAIAIRQLYHLPARGPGPGIRLLVIMGPGDLMANTPVEFLIEDSDVALTMLYMTTESDWPLTIPEHDVLLVGVAESDRNQRLLQRLADDLQDWPRPVINRPERIAVLSRDGACAALAGIAGVEMPATVRIDRAQLQAIGDRTLAATALLPDGDFPVIVRPTGSHAGQHLDKLMTPADVAGYLERVDAARFYLSRFVDYRNTDGQFRKYRITLVDGEPFICHYAISSHWMIHYLNAGMTESQAKRDEEADCMAHFDTQFALRHAAAIQTIFTRLGLAYVGIDCAETPDGKLLIFEVDNAMIVHDMDPEGMFPYKKPVMHKVFAAFRSLLEKTRATN